MKKVCLSRVSIHSVSGFPPYITRRNCVFASSRRRLDAFITPFYHPVFWCVFKQGRDGVVDDSHDTLEMFLTVCDVLVETRTLEVVSLEELRADAR